LKNSWFLTLYDFAPEITNMASDATYNLSAFSPKNVPEQTSELNAMLIEKGSQGPKWWEVIVDSSLPTSI
jgi:hypothetical protein